MFKKNKRSYSGILDQIKLVLKLMRDSDVPTYLKLIPIAVVAYLVSPIDLLPEAVAGPLGFGDDALAVLVGLDWFIRMVPKSIVARHTGEEDVADVVDGEYTNKADANYHDTVNLKS